MASAIEIKNFKKSFGKKQVHQDICLTVEEGECLGILGGSGAGKSVILRSLIGLEKPDQGSIAINGVEITTLNEHQLIEIRKKVAYVFQGGALFDSMSVYDNLAYSLREHTDLSEADIRLRVRDLLVEFGLEGNEKVFPAQLSGGMQKRVGLARSIILDPAIILYDEPTAGLDPFNTRKIQDMILRNKARKKTSVLVTHDMPSALEVCDRIALVLHGRIAVVSAVSKGLDPAIESFIKGEEP